MCLPADCCATLFIPTLVHPIGVAQLRLPAPCTRGWNPNHWGPVGMGTHSRGSSGYGSGYQWVWVLVLCTIFSIVLELKLSFLQTSRLCACHNLQELHIVLPILPVVWRNSNSPTKMGSIWDLTLEQHLEATLNTLSDGAEVAWTAKNILASWAWSGDL